ncbi:MAG: hypothetical protein Q9M13_03745 [Mariprofundales bacterium]|nr:hypothetical protein [Mariprofundales bacterium]
MTSGEVIIPLSTRLLFGCSLLLSAIFATTHSQALLTLLIAVVTAPLLKDLSKLWRAMRHLRWLLMPIVLLHLLFTPGMLLLPSAVWSPTVEGVDAAIWLSLRLINWFIAGWIAAHLVSYQEWQQLLTRLPRGGGQWGSILISLPPMLHRCRQIMMQMRWRWQLEGGGWRDIAPLASTMVAVMLAQGALQAEAYWLLHIENRAALTTPPPSAHPYAWLLTTLIGAGWATVWLTW